MIEKSGPGQPDRKAVEQRPEQVGTESRGEPRSAAEKVAQADLAESDAALVNPYPAYEDKSLDELRAAAENRGVEINRDVEKAHLVWLLRQKNDHGPEYDLMPLEKLREVAGKEGVELDEEFEKAHWVTELHAADTHTG